MTPVMTTNIATTLENWCAALRPKPRPHLYTPRDPPHRRCRDRFAAHDRLVLGVEDAFGITVDDQDLDRVKTFGELVDLVGARTAEPA